MTNIGIIIKLWKNMKRKKMILSFFFLSLVNALLESINVGLILPLIKIISDPESLNHIELFKILFSKIDLDPRLFIIIIFTTILLFSSVFRIFMNWYTLKVSYEISENIASEIFEIVLNKPYLRHIKEKSSKTISDIVYRVEATKNIILSIGLFINNSVLSLSILSMLLFVDFINIGFFLLLLGSIYISITYLFKKRLFQNSKNISDNQTMLIKIIQESLGGIKEIIFTTSHKLFINDFRKRFKSLNQSLIYNQFISQSPKIIIETLAILAVIIFYFFSQNNNIDFISTAGTIGLIVVGAQKLLPSLQVLYSNWSNITNNKFLANEILEKFAEIKFTNSGLKKIDFNSSLKIKVDKFGYSDEKTQLSDIELEIKKGDRIGIVGDSGSGKTTLVNIISGLITEFKGEINIDGIILDSTNINSWRKNMTYVSQNIYLFDSSLEENIKFGETVDKDVTSIINKVKLNYLLEEKDLKNLLVGENSNKISGGEKQRIAIARAIYRDSNFLIFDEATNALDKKLEKEILDLIYSQNDKTIIIITHDVSNLYGCNKVFNLNTKRITSTT